MAAPITKLIQKNNFQFGHIEGLRALAALSLMFCHIGVYGSFFLEKSQYYTMLSQPQIKVLAITGIFLDVFFVISGFLISYFLIKEYKEKNTVNLGGFLIRRFARIYPLYCLILLLGLPFSLAKVHSIWSNLLLVNNFLPIKDQYMNWCWTIAVEFQFYFIFGIIITLVSKNIIGKKTCIILAIFFITIPLIIMGNYIFKHHYYYFPKEVFLATTQEFRDFVSIGFDKIYLHSMSLTYGVLTAYALVYHKSRIDNFIQRASEKKINILSLLLLGSLFTLFSNHHVWYINKPVDLWQNSTIWMLLCYHTLFYPPLCLLLLLTSSPKGTIIKSIVNFLSAIVWRPIARLSYGTYLLHPLFLLIGFSIYTATHQSFSIGDYFQFGFFLILLTYIVAIPLYLFYEQPLLKTITNYLKGRNKTPDPLPTLSPAGVTE